MVAVVAFAIDVGTVTPFKVSVVTPLIKPVPVTVSVVETAPTVALTGESDERIGIGACTASVMGFDVPPFGGGFVTVSDRFAGMLRSAAERLTFRLVGFTNVVVRFAPLIATVDCETKLVPVMVTVVVAAPARTEVGESEVKIGRASCRERVCMLV